MSGLTTSHPAGERPTPLRPTDRHRAMSPTTDGNRTTRSRQ